MDMSKWPRVYRASSGWMWFMLATGTVCVALGLAFLVFGAGAAKPPSAHVATYGAGLLLLIFGAAGVASILRFRIVLTEHSIEVHGLFKVAALRRDEIVGRRLLGTGASAQIRLTSADPNRKPLAFARIFRTDDALSAWLQTIPDLDAAAQLHAQEAALANPEFGETPEERAEHLARYARRAKTLAYACAAASVWGLAYPRPYVLVIVILLLLPCVVVVLVKLSKGALGINENAEQGGALVATSLIVPSMVLALRTSLDVHSIDMLSALGVAAAVGAAITFGLWRIERRPKSTSFFLMCFVLAVPYAYGVLMQSNVLLDPSHHQRFEVSVLEKHSTSGKGANWRFRLPPWGPVTEEESVVVSKSFYDSVAVGDKVCIALFEGRWSFAWFVAQPCPEASPS